MNVLVTDLRYRMALAAVRDLADAGHTVYGLHFGSNTPPPAALSRCLAGWTAAEDTEGASRAEATRREAERRSAVIFPVGAKTIAALAEQPESSALVPTPTQLCLAGDKARVLALAEQLGVETPRSWDMPAAATLPAVVKYRDGERLALHAAQRYAVCADRAQLEKTWEQMCGYAAAHGQEPPLIQKYIGGDGFGVSCVFDRESRPVSVICHRRLREYPITGGPSAACETIWDDGLVRRALTLLSALEWRGIAMVEFRGTINRPVLMEINPRIWGTFPLTRVSKSGFSDAYARAAKGERLPGNAGPSYETGVKMGFCLSNLAAAAAYLTRLHLAKGFSAIHDAFSLPDGVLESTDRRPGYAYLRQALLRRER